MAEQLAAHGMADETELLMAAVLHDVVEDTDATEAELAAAFGPRVAGIVMEVTDDKSLQGHRFADALILNGPVFRRPDFPSAVFPKGLP